MKSYEQLVTFHCKMLFFKLFLFCCNFVEYNWGMEAFMIAHDRVINGRKDFLIIILKEKMNLDNLPAELRTYLRKLKY